MAQQTVADVVVVGGGVAGLCAAIAAHDAGAKTVLLEASELLGGTASWSGGAIWIPMNHCMRRAGRPDSRAAALAYMQACAQGKTAPELLDTYLDEGPAVLEFLERATPLEFEVGTMPDYYDQYPGAVHRPGESRSVAPAIFDTHRLGDRRTLLRRSPYGTIPFSFEEFSRFQAILHPERIDFALMKQRLDAGYVGWGEALSAGLLAAVLERGVDVRVSSRVRSLLIEGGVRGVRVDGAGSSYELAARHGVVLCTGGFEWDPELVEEQFGVHWTPSTVETNRGDGWHMAEQAGAQLTNRGVCWGWPTYMIPGEKRTGGLPLVRTSLVERGLPHSIIVDRRGERFVDESAPYHRILKVLLEREAQGFRHLPAWQVLDQQFLDKYPFGPVMAGQPAPEWLHRFESLPQLAAGLGIDAAALARTVREFNEAAVLGRDARFGRGESAYARFFADPDNSPNPSLGPLSQAPFYAIEVLPSTIGTCAGPRIDTRGRVLAGDGQPVPGLFAAGNAAAAISGPAYFGPGGTIGPAMVFGVLAGRTAAKGTPHG
ncbi:MAG: FAD-dependent oxidoreductase [Proteobacteria bacterium]|nr:FAD-dependent oxidoreductase [Pseudomonadota bacterium]